MKSGDIMWINGRLWQSLIILSDGIDLKDAV